MRNLIAVSIFLFGLLFSLGTWAEDSLKEYPLEKEVIAGENLLGIKGLGKYSKYLLTQTPGDQDCNLIAFLNSTLLNAYSFDNSKYNTFHEILDTISGEHSDLFLGQQENKVALLEHFKSVNSAYWLQKDGTEVPSFGEWGMRTYDVFDYLKNKFSTLENVDSKTWSAHLKHTDFREVPATLQDFQNSVLFSLKHGYSPTLQFGYYNCVLDLTSCERTGGHGINVLGISVVESQNYHNQIVLKTFDGLRKSVIYFSVTVDTKSKLFILNPLSPPDLYLEKTEAGKVMILKEETIINLVL